MTMHAPILMEQQAHHKALRASLLRPAAAIEIETKQEKRIRMLETTARSLRFELEQRDAEIRQLKTDLADRNARVLDQADKLCKMMRIESEDEEFTPVRRVADIVAEVLQDYPGVTMADIVSVRRTRDLIKPRHRCYYEVYRQRPDLSFPAMGRYFKRDHSSLHHAIDKFKIGNER